MTNPMFNPQPNYSGVTIQIANPAVNVVPSDGKNIPCVSSGYYGVNPNGLPNYQNNYITYPQGTYNSYPQRAGINGMNEVNGNYQIPEGYAVQNPEAVKQNIGYPNAYPAQYYLNNYNYAGNDDGKKLPENRLSENQKSDLNDADNFSNRYSVSDTQRQSFVDNTVQSQKDSNLTNPNQYRMYADRNIQKDNDMSKSEVIKENLAEREAEIAEEKKNTKETKIVALTDEYIKSLENYLNNPNDEIRLMASKEILTRLDEDKDRYDDAALNALLNKMMQDPNKLVRIAALSAFSAQLASGNDYTVKLLHNIQTNPNSDKEDVLQAADILLKMSAGVEVKNIPNPSVKEKPENK